MSATLSPPRETDQRNQAAEPKPPLYRRAIVLHSFWILVFLFSLDLALRYVKPLKYFEVPGVIFQDGDYHMAKIDIALAKGRRTDVLLLGSSTLAVAAVHGDFGVETNHRSKESNDTYADAKVLENLIQKRFGINLRCTNVGISGAMVSDDLVILEQYLKGNPPPRAVFVMLAGRDFADSNSMSPDKSRISQHFRQVHHAGFLDKIDSEIQNVWRLYGRRGDYEQLLEILACAATNREPTLYAATHKTPGKSQRNAEVRVKLPFLESWQLSGDRRADDLAQYKDELKNYYARSFAGVASSKIKYQADCLQSIALHCSEAGSSLVLVQMPISPEFKDVIPEAISDRITNELGSVANKYRNSTLIDFSNDKAFGNEDFSDGVHLTAEGSAKFWERLTERLAEGKFATDVRRK